MNTFRVERAGNKYQVIEELPGRGTFEVVGFATEADARTWLDSYLRISRETEARATGGR